MDDRPRISIILATYKRPHTLPRAIASVCAQTYPDWELIVVDNAGEARCPVVEPRLRWHVHAERASVSYARNQGLGHATGDLVCFLDDDDELFPDYLATFVETLREHPAARMVRCSMLSRGREVRSFGTPLCCLRREHATPTWDGTGLGEDTRYFKRIVAAHGWTENAGDIVIVRRPLCRVHEDPVGGMRAGSS